MDRELSGIGGSVDKTVCACHIDDYAIQSFINKTGENGRCDYCEEDNIVVEVNELMVFIMAGINRLFTDAGEFMPYDSSEGGYLGETFDDNDLIELIDLNIDNYELQKDICYCIADRAWAKEYGNDKAEILTYGWKYFKEVVKHHSRYLFSQTSKFHNEETRQNSFEILNDIGMIARKYGLYTTISSSVALYRCRQHAIAEVIKPPKDLASPPRQYAIYPNRMSPAGISMFYAGFDRDTAIEETIDYNNTKKKRITSGRFLPKCTIRVLDFSRLPQLPSIFDEEKFPDYFPISFLKSFVTDLSGSIVHDGKEHIEYVPTQIVTEFFRFTFAETNTLPINGIVYPSSRCRGKNACVLFMDHEQSLKELDFDPASLETIKVGKISKPTSL
ncbi:HEPN-associated N-terminal domain-containing protein [Chitinophaga sp. SYP-B3965]|uniref:HEPN-associated N-terminal domain-containing protein n=1 Tax=Chitinophaga sp. SYP-B3965 TaxID=2663120 RepID=UPI0015642215|nr:HEPN-associated N-terminal domain-containing protein [Chitinophaga sp. SYP-B3965]